MTRPPPPPSTSSLVPDHDQLPDYISAAAREALRHPGDDLVLTAVSAGQLLRAGAVRGAARAKLRAWLAGLSAQQLGVLGEMARQQLSASARSFQDFVGRTPSAQEMLRAGGQSMEVEPALASNVVPFPRHAGWLVDCITHRDRAESLLVALGIVVLDAVEPDQQELAGSHERATRQQAQSVDETAQALGVMLGDETAGWRPEPWFERMATHEPEHWWMGLAFSRSAARRPVEQAAPVPHALAPVLTLRLPRTGPTRIEALAAHGHDDSPPVSGPETIEKKQDTLWIELSSVKEPGQAGVVLNLWLTDESTLDLSGESVQLLDLGGQPLPVMSRGPKPRRWWAHFQAEGTFLVKIVGLEQPIALAVQRGE